MHFHRVGTTWLLIAAARALRPDANMCHRLRTTWLLLGAARALQPDANMMPTYARLAERCANLHTKLQRQVWIGIAGGPGAGKSTVAEAVAQCCNDLGVRATALPCA